MDTISSVLEDNEALHLGCQLANKVSKYINFKIIRGKRFPKKIASKISRNSFLEAKKVYFLMNKMFVQKDKI